MLSQNAVTCMPPAPGRKKRNKQIQKMQRSSEPSHAFSHVKHWEANFDVAKKSSLQQPWKITTWGTPFQNDKRFGSQWCYSESLVSNKAFCLVGHRRENVGTQMHFHFGEQMDSSNFLIEKATSPNALGEKHVSFSRPWILSWVSGRQRNSASHDRRFPGISWKHAIDRLIAWQVRS